MEPIKRSRFAVELFTGAAGEGPGMLPLYPAMSMRRIHAFYGLLDRLQRRQVSRRFDAAVARQHLTRAQLESYAADRLHEVLESALRLVPFYSKRLGAVAGDPGVLATEAFYRIPVLEKHDVASAGTDLRARGLDGPVQTVSSGGTTGPPTEIAIDLETLDAQTGAGLRTYLWWGGDPTRRHVMLWGPPPDENTYGSFAGRLRGRVLGRELLETYGQDAERARSHWLRITRRPLDHVAGYSSALVRVANASREGECARVRRGVAAAAEPIFDFQKPSIEQAFGAPVRERYGCNEFASVAHECAAGSLHVATDRVLFEIVRDDGKPAAPGEIGRVLVTDLDNRFMPLIRYRIGDLAEWGHDCGCGLPFPVLARVHGRERDRIRARSGQQVSPHAIAVPLEGTPVLGFQVLVDSMGGVRAIHLQGESFQLDSVREAWAEILGTADFEVRFVSDVERSRSGKILPVLVREGD